MDLSLALMVKLPMIWSLPLRTLSKRQERVSKVYKWPISRKLNDGFVLLNPSSQRGCSELDGDYSCRVCASCCCFYSVACAPAEGRMTLSELSVCDLPCFLGLTI